MRYDVAIIGAGANGLAAAATLGQAGLKAVVIERNQRPGGRLVTREFHPGFHASPFADALTAIPSGIIRSLGLAQQGVVFLPTPTSLALWPDRLNVLAPSAPAMAAFEACAARVLARAMSLAARPPCPTFPERDPWPGVRETLPSLDEILAPLAPDMRAHIAAMALSGRAADPYLAGSAVHLLAPAGGSNIMVAGGLGRLADALLQVAQDAGARIACGLGVREIICQRGRANGVILADGSVIDARAVISTLDVKRTLLSLRPPSKRAGRIDTFRITGSAARVLLALENVPAVAKQPALQGPIHIAPNLLHISDAYMAWRAGTLAAHLPITLRIPSLLDPTVAAPGNAVMTATVGAVPYRLADETWTRAQRDALRDNVLAVVDTVMPGITARVSAAEVIVPEDMEDELAATAGDLWGGEIASDQMFDLRPWSGSPRAPISRLYLGGMSAPAGPFATCAAGVAAARCVIGDLKWAIR